MECCYCHERDESKLIISTRNVNGKVESIDICLSCSWRDDFLHKTKGEDGDALREECERADNKASAGSLDSLALQE